MTGLGWLCVATGGMVGAVIRYWISYKLNHKGGFPAGTFAVNMSGAFLAGIFSGLAAGSPAHAFIVYGILGALTTFSTWNSEILDLWQDGQRTAAVLYALFTLFLGIIFYH